MLYMVYLGVLTEIWKHLSILKSTPLNLSICEKSCKTKIFKFETKKCLIRVFLGCNLEELSVYEKSALSNCKVLCKSKNLLKNWYRKFLIWESKLIIIENSIFEFVKMQSFTQKQKPGNLGQWPIWVYFRLQFKKLLLYLKSEPQTLSKMNF